jgi:hypothetical protein
MATPGMIALIDKKYDIHMKMVHYDAYAIHDAAIAFDRMEYSPGKTVLEHLFEFGEHFISFWYESDTQYCIDFEEREYLEHIDESADPEHISIQELVDYIKTTYDGIQYLTIVDKFHDPVQYHNVDVL